MTMLRCISIIVLLLALSPGVVAQKKKNSFNSMSRDSQAKFLDKQWWLGFKAGVNLSNPIPTERYSVITPTNYSLESAQKEYDHFNKPGVQATLEVTFNFKAFAISVQPTYRSSVFTYTHQMDWQSTENTEDHLLLKFDQEQKVEYADFPLIAKYELGGYKLRPYVQLGVFYSLLIDATKTVTVSGTDHASGGTNSFENEPLIVGAKDLFTNSWGLMGGAGLHYNLGNIRLVLDVSYRQGMSNMANTNNRYSNDRLNGIGEAQDDLKLNNLVFSAGCLFPLRFLSKNYNSI
jgi:outer membrane protein W